MSRFFFRPSGMKSAYYAHLQDKKSSRATNIASGRNILPATVILPRSMFFQGERRGKREEVRILSVRWPLHTP